MGGLIPNASTFGPAIDSLFMLVLVLTGIAFVLVEGLLVIFLIRYRHRPGRQARYVHGSRPVELAWTAGTGLALLSLALYQRTTWVEIKQELPDEATAVLVGLSAKQFEWHASYPGADGLLDTSDDIIAPNNLLHLPVDRPVIFVLEAEDVLHSFFVPVFRLKQDVVPGVTIRAWVQATETGEFEIACAELCGLGHYRMRGRITVEPQADFETWLADLQARSN